MSASISPPGRWIEQSWPETRSISSYSWIVYCWSSGDVRVAVERVHAAGRVPGRAGRQLAPLEEHDVGPAGLRQVVQHAGADHAATDDDDLGR